VRSAQARSIRPLVEPAGVEHEVRFDVARDGDGRKDVRADVRQQPREHLGTIRRELHPRAQVLDHRVALRALQTFRPGRVSIIRLQRNRRERRRCEGLLRRRFGQPREAVKPQAQHVCEEPARRDDERENCKSRQNWPTRNRAGSRVFERRAGGARGGHGRSRGHGHR
jgi:hypothetical protein